MKRKCIGLLERILKKGYLVCLYESEKNNFTITVSNKNEKEICLESEGRLSLVINKAYLQIFGIKNLNTNDNESRIIERWLNENKSLSLSWTEGCFCIEAKEVAEISPSKSKEILGKNYSVFKEKFFYFQKRDIDMWPIFRNSFGKSVLAAFLALPKSESKYGEPSKLLCSI